MPRVAASSTPKYGKHQASGQARAADSPIGRNGRRANSLLALCDLARVVRRF